MELLQCLVIFLLVVVAQDECDQCQFTEDDAGDCKFPFIDQVLAVSRSVKDSDVAESPKVTALAADVSTVEGRQRIVQEVDRLWNVGDTKKQLRFLIHSAGVMCRAAPLMVLRPLVGPAMALPKPPFINPSRYWNENSDKPVARSWLVASNQVLWTRTSKGPFVMHPLKPCHP